MFKSLENKPLGTTIELDQALDALQYNKGGLVPAIAQQHDTKEVLMLAWMNREAIMETLRTGHVCYWSRSRQKYWKKGEESGHVQMLREMRIDCDGDALLLMVDQTGPACHTNRRDCFFWTVEGNSIRLDESPEPEDR